MRYPVMAASLVLQPEHQEDLARSGLTEATRRAAGLRSLSPNEWPAYLPESLRTAISSALLIPYPTYEGFYRVRLFPPAPTPKGTIRYYQPAGSASHLYLPPRAQAALADPSVPLHWAEGEKKALAVDQAGLACIGLGGLWNWLENGRPIADLDRIDHRREQVIIPDSDVWVRPDLLQAVYAFGRELAERGASVRVAKLSPAAPAPARGAE